MQVLHFQPKGRGAQCLAPLQNMKEGETLPTQENGYPRRQACQTGGWESPRVCMMRVTASKRRKEHRGKVNTQ